MISYFPICLLKIESGDDKHKSVAESFIFLQLSLSNVGHDQDKKCKCVHYMIIKSVWNAYKSISRIFISVIKKVGSTLIYDRCLHLMVVRDHIAGLSFIIVNKRECCISYGKHHFLSISLYYQKINK